MEGKAHLQGAELSGREMLIKAAELILESLQDEYYETNTSKGASLGADGKPSGFNMSHGSSTSRKVNSPSSISAAERLEILVDYLHQHGSILSSADKLKVKGLHQAEPLSWTFADIKDYSNTKSESFKANFQPGDTFPVSGGYNKAKEQTEGYTRASVFQGDKNKEDKENPEGQKIPHGINTNREKAQETTSKSKSSMGIPLVYVNREKFAKDFENISKLFNAPQQEAPPAAEQENLSDRVRKLRELFGQAKDTKETDKKNAETKNNQALEQALADKIAEQLRFKGLAVDEAKIQQTVKAVLKQYPTKEAHQALGNALYEHDEKFRNLVDELAYGKPGVKPVYFAVPIGINGLIAGLGLLAACNIYYFTNKVSNKNSPEDNGYQPYEDEGQGNTGFQAHRDDNKRKEGYQAGETVEGSDGFEAEQKKWSDYLYHFPTIFSGFAIFMERNKVSSPNARVTNPSPSSSSPNDANNPHAQAALNKKMSALEGAQNDAVKVENLPDGRIRYYDAERPSRNPGPTKGSSFVTEYNPKTGQVRQWNESYDQSGNINRIHPKTLDGQDVRAQHYPPTKAELEQSTKKTGGAK